MLALFVLGFGLELFPLSGLGPQPGLLNLLHHAALPVLVLASFYTAHYYLVLRASVADLQHRPFIQAARARGLSEGRVLFGHALPNALLPFIALVGLGLGFAVGGALLVEIVFSWPGMGTLVLSAVTNRDYPLLQGSFLVLALAVLASNFLADVLSGLCDPRSRRPS